MSVYEIETEDGSVYEIETEDTEPTVPLSVGETLAGGLQSILSGMTFGAGDEISAGLNAGIDAVTGGPGYDARLQQARDLESRYAQEHPISAGYNELLGIAAPAPKIFSAEKGLATAAKNIGKGAALGAGYGGAAGFLSGEGEGRISGAERGAIAGGATGGALSGLGEMLAGLGNRAPEFAAAENRKSIGTRQTDYTKGGADLQTIEIPEEGLVTRTKAALDDLLMNGKLGESRDPQTLLAISKANQKELGKQVATAIGEFDKAGGVVVPQWENTLAFLESGRAGDKTESFIKKLADLEELINREGRGRASYLQQQKIAKGLEWNPSDSLMNDYNRAVYADLQGAIEQVVPEVGPLNAELAKYKVADPIIKRSLGASENKDLGAKIINFTKTTGGVGAQMITGAAIGGLPGAMIGAGTGLATKALLSPSGRKFQSDLSLKLMPKLLGISEKAIRSSGGTAAVLGSLAGDSADRQESKSSNPQTIRPNLRSTSKKQGEQISQRLQSGSSLFSPASYPSSLFNSRPESDLTQGLFGAGGSNSYEDTMKNNDVDVDSLVKAVIHQESRGNPNTPPSPKGAVGLMQIMPGTAREIADELGLKTYDLKDAATNKLMGTYYLRKMLDKFGDPELALAAYNAGPGRVQGWIEKYGENWADIAANLSKIGAYKETRNYVPQVLARLQGLNDVVEV